MGSSQPNEMDRHTPHILAVDGQVSIHGVFERLFPREGIQVTTCASVSEAMELLQDSVYDLILCDSQTPNASGIELLEYVQEHHPNIGVVLLSTQDNVQSAVRAMQKGALDYIPKPFSTDELVERVKILLERQAETASRGTAPSTAHAAKSEADHRSPAARNGDGDAQNPESTEDLGLEPESEDVQAGSVNFVGEHRSIERLKKMIPRVAGSDAPLFVHGESGTGKEILSRLVHEKSPRADNPFVAINCATLPRELVESHLFGHVEGAFTGAIDDSKGAFEQADGGTLLLDEVTEVTPSVQAKLLRVLQDQEFKKVGSSKKQTVDVRIIATTNRDLEDAVNAGDFREDLYHRLAVFPLHIPPLRGRLSDIPLLAEHFIEVYTERYGLSQKTISPSLLQYFQTYHWPGNVRELENKIHRGVVMAAEKDCIEKDDVLNEFFSTETPDTHGESGTDTIEDIVETDETPTIAQMERKLILRTLAEEDVSQKGAAQKLGISARTIRNKLQEYRSQGFSV